MELEWDCNLKILYKYFVVIMQLVIAKILI